MTAPRLCTVLGLVLLLVAPALAEGPSVTIEPADGKPIDRSTPVTFGWAFRPGQIPRMTEVRVQISGGGGQTQVDVKRTWPDGSVKHAVVSMYTVIPGDPRNLSFTADFPTPSVRRPPVSVPGNLQASAEFTFPDGTKRRADLGKALRAATRPDYWLQGQVVAEQIASTRPEGADGQPDPDLLVQFHVRYYNGGPTRLAVVVEKDTDSGSDGGIVYDLAIKSGDKVLAEAKDVQQPDYTRCRQVVWLGGEPRAIRVKYDAKAWAAAGLIPNYDFSLQVPDGALAGLGTSLAKAKRAGLFGNGIVTDYFPMTGGRPDIGVLPRWTVFYLLTMDARAERAMLDCAERAAYVPIHMRRSATGRVPLHTQEPKLWFDYRAQGKEKFRRSAGPARAEVKPVFSPDIAHQPELAYVPYLITGDRYYLDELYAWATYSVLNNAYRGPDGTITTGQERATAWGLRTVAAAAMIAPDGEPELADFNDRVEKSVKSYCDFLAGPQCGPLKPFVPQQNEQGLSVAPWQHDYFICAVDFVARGGFKSAEQLRGLLLEFSLGRFTHGEEFDPACGLGYWWVVGAFDKAAKKPAMLGTWKELFERNYLDKDGQRKKAEWADYPGGYGDVALAAAAIALRAGQKDGKVVYDYLFEKCPGVRKGRPAAPEWAISPEPVK